MKSVITEAESLASIRRVFVAILYAYHTIANSGFDYDDPGLHVVKAVKLGLTSGVIEIKVDKAACEAPKPGTYPWVANLVSTSGVTLSHCH